MGGVAGRVCCGDVVADAIISSLSLVLFFYMFNMMYYHILSSSSSSLSLFFSSLYLFFFFFSSSSFFVVGSPSCWWGCRTAQGDKRYTTVSTTTKACAQTVRNTVSAYLSGSLVLQRRTGYCSSWFSGCSGRFVRCEQTAVRYAKVENQFAWLSSTPLLLSLAANKC